MFIFFFFALHYLTNTLFLGEPNKYIYLCKKLKLILHGPIKKIFFTEKLRFSLMPRSRLVPQSCKTDFGQSRIERY